MGKWLAVSVALGWTACGGGTPPTTETAGASEAVESEHAPVTEAPADAPPPDAPPPDAPRPAPVAGDVCPSPANLRVVLRRGAEWALQVGVQWEKVGEVLNEGDPPRVLSPDEAHKLGVGAGEHTDVVWILPGPGEQGCRMTGGDYRISLDGLNVIEERLLVGACNVKRSAMKNVKATAFHLAVARPETLTGCTLQTAALLSEQLKEGPPPPSTITSVLPKLECKTRRCPLRWRMRGTWHASGAGVVDVLATRVDRSKGRKCEATSYAGVYARWKKDQPLQELSTGNARPSLYGVLVDRRGLRAAVLADYQNVAVIPAGGTSPEYTLGWYVDASMAGTPEPTLAPRCAPAP